MEVTTQQEAPDNPVRTGVSQSYDWYSEGESRSVQVDGVRVEVRYVARKGRRARISITAPRGAVFQELGSTITKVQHAPVAMGLEK